MNKDIVRDVISQAHHAISQEDGHLLSSLLHPIQQPIPQYQLLAADNACSVLPSPFDEMFLAYFMSLPSLSANDYIAAYPHISALFKAFTKALAGSEGNWLLPVLNTCIVLLRQVAKHADEMLEGSGQKAEKLEDAERSIKSIFSLTFNDRAPLPQSKKWGALSIINNLFKIYFLLNNLRLCKNLIAYVKGPGFPELSKFPVAQYVTYNYFVGRLSMFHGDYKKAREELRIAFSKCTKRAFKNKRLILTYLIPCELLAGRLPTPELLRTYQLEEFSELVNAMRTGNLLAFNRALAGRQQFFIQKGIYLVLEKLKYLTYRNLFKKVYLIMKSSKLQIVQFRKALSWQGMEMDTDEIECILANLIFQGYIKGYISHKMGVLVVSPTNAFPSL
jgi:hypothetical protein